MSRSAGSRPPVLVAGLVMVALLAVVAACGGPAASSSAPAQPAPSAGKYPATKYPLTIRQPDGSSAVIRSRPMRVVTVDNPAFAVDELVSLGVVPVGGLVYPSKTAAFDDRGVPIEVASRVPSFAAAGAAPSKPDLEKIVALHPDLIIGTNGAGTPNLKQLEAIAPVADLGLNASATGRSPDTLIWAPQLRLLGYVLDRQTQAAQVISGFEAAAAPVRTALAGKSAAIILPEADGTTVNVVGPHQQPNGHLLEYLGLTVQPIPGDAKQIADGGGNVATLSLERIGEITANYLVLVGSDGPARALLQQPLVQQLPQVKAGHVVVVGTGFGTGVLNSGPVGEQACLQGIQRAFQ